MPLARDAPGASEGPDQESGPAWTRDQIVAQALIAYPLRPLLTIPVVKTAKPL